jgi:hypothetical protein
MKAVVIVALTAAVAMSTANVLAAGTARKSASGGGVVQTRLVSLPASNPAVSTSSSSYVNLPGAATTIPVAKGSKALILIRFSGASSCDYGGSGIGLGCELQVLVDGKTADPNPAGSFDTANTTAGVTDYYEQHATDRWFGPVGPGKHTIRVRWATTNGDSTFRFFGWTLVVQTIKA